MAAGIFGPILKGYYWSVGVLWFLTSLCFVQLLAYVLLKRFPALAVAAVAMAGTAASVDLPNYFLLKTWLPGLSFFALGYFLAQRQWRIPLWLWVPLLAAVILLAPLNTGCPFTLDRTCSNVGSGLFGVWMFAGIYGFLPLFFLSSLLGSVATISLSAGLARIRAASELFAYIGRNSLDLFILNGFVATFLNYYIAQIHWPQLNALYYAGLAIGMVALHLAAMLLLRPVLRAINSAAVAIAGFIVKAVAKDVKERQPEPV
jgi:fucose 4-O-acetylase-like acetyltransferase